MFPNPQDAFPLPQRPSLEGYQKLASELVVACKSANEAALRDWAEKWLAKLVKDSGLTFGRELPQVLGRWVRQLEAFTQRELLTAPCNLATSRYIIARSHGFGDWRRFTHHLKELASRNSSIWNFETAADAIVSGNLSTLRRLLRRDRKLVKMRSTREHHATLLHYVSANGVEGYRQKTPANIVQIAQLLLQAGAEVDAEADVYGGGATTLLLAATSVHPDRAGVQNQLMQLLLDHGAAIDRRTSNGARQYAVDACLANGRGAAAQYLAERGAHLNLETAAGVGRLDVVQNFLKRKPSPKRTYHALKHACAWGRNDIVEYLLDHGTDLSGHRDDGQTPLHCAAITGQLDTIKLLLKRNAPLESKNIYGGTVLGQTMWSAAHGGDPDLYEQIIETLIAAGAKVPERHVPVNKQIDDLLRRYGSIPEPSWWWFGEEPLEEKKVSTTSR